MGIASMVIGIVAVIIGFIPFCGAWAIIPACAGLGLGIADVIVKSKRKQSKGMAITGLILNPIAMIIIIAWWMSIAYATSQAVDTMGADFQQQMQQLQNLQNLQPNQNPVPSVPLPNQNPPQPMQPMQPVPQQPQPAQPVPTVQPVPQPAPQPVPVQPAPQ
jgi:outer membrane biosynthesis protein TonB